MNVVIFRYTRAEALTDGVLVDVTETAKEAGFRYPTAVTRAVWERYVAVPEDLSGEQDEAGRLWDILWMLRFATRRSQGETRDVRFELYVRMKPGEDLELVTLKAVCGPGDEAEPVVTIMLPDED